MRQFNRNRNPFILPSVILVALAFMQCEPGKSLDPIPKVETPVDSGKVAKIEVTSAPSSVLPGETTAVEVVFTDSASGNPLKGAKLSVTSTQFTILASSASKAFDLDSLPDDGKVSFRIASTTTGNGTINVKVTSGTKIRNKSIIVIVTEKPVAPKVVETLPNKVAVKDTTPVSFTIVDSAAERPLANAVVTVTSSLYSIFDPKTKDTLSTDTTGSDGKSAFLVYAATNGGGAGTLTVKVKTAAGITRTVTYTLATFEDSTQDRPRKMVFTALRSSLRADGTDSTELRVLIKDDNNNPMGGEKLRFTATGGVVRAEAVTDAWGMATTILRSERVNRSVVVTATLEKTGATAQQTVSFDGVNITISPSKRVLMKDSINYVLFELKDGSNVPMSGDSVEIVAKGALKGFAQGGKDSMVVVTDTKGQYRTFITSDKEQSIIITAKALGAKAQDTVGYTTNILGISMSKASIQGDGLDQMTLTASLRNGQNQPMESIELRWSTTFGTFTTTPFTQTNGNGTSTIILRAPRGSGTALVNVEAYEKSGATRTLKASGNIPVPVKALKVAKVVLKVTPDNIPVLIGETRMIAQAYDSANNYMAGVLISFRMVKGAGGGDESISPPVDYTKAGQAEATFKAGGVISLYRGVKLAALALDISGTDTLVVASSDTVGLTVSGPPHRISVGVNILKGENPNDGTFSLPTAAVVTDVNGNLVADGTPVNFSTTPIAAWYWGLSYRLIEVSPYYSLDGGDTAWFRLPWTDYNSNAKLDQDEEVSDYSVGRNRPFRGEDRDGNGIIQVGPDPFVDINHNGVWDSVGAEPFVPMPINDTSGIRNFVDFNKDGVRQSAELYIDYNGDGKCSCAGTRDAAGNLYEASYFNSTPNHPFPGEVSVGIQRQVATGAGKAVTKITYVQSHARYVEVRVTAESNGITSSVDVHLPIVKDEE